MEDELLRECLLFAYETDCPPSAGGPLDRALARIQTELGRNRQCTEPNIEGQSDECLLGEHRSPVR